MGMAASQVRLLQLTDRKNTIGRELQHLSLQKTSLSRDMQRVTKNYQAALSSKTLKFSNNAGVTYVDLSYANLMRPSAANGNKPYLLTNASNQIIVDSKYEKYAEIRAFYKAKLVDLGAMRKLKTSCKTRPGHFVKL